MVSKSCPFFKEKCRRDKCAIFFDDDCSLSRIDDIAFSLRVLRSLNLLEVSLLDKLTSLIGKRLK